MGATGITIRRSILLIYIRKLNYDWYTMVVFRLGGSAGFFSMNKRFFNLFDLFGYFSEDLAIDLGTANTLVYVLGKGIMVREPSVVARHRKTKAVLAIGREARRMLGKTPPLIETVRPLQHGVIADFDAASAMLSHYIKVTTSKKGVFGGSGRPRVIVGIPSGVTEVERRAVWEAALEAGAREAYIIEEPMAAAIGAGLSINDARGVFIVDIGGGTTEIAVISLGGIVLNKSIRVAGDEMNETIINFLRLKHSLLVGVSSAEDVKIAVGSSYPMEREKQFVVRGRDLESGLPKSIKVTSVEIREALASVVNQIVDEIKMTIEETPPELLGDIMEQGIVLAGGGALIWGIEKTISETVKIRARVSEDPLTCVVRGGAKVLADKSLLDRVKVTGGLR